MRRIEDLFEELKIDADNLLEYDAVEYLDIFNEEAKLHRWKMIPKFSTYQQGKLDGKTNEKLTQNILFIL